jgi:hypothetical protein
MKALSMIAASLMGGILACNGIAQTPARPTNPIHVTEGFLLGRVVKQGTLIYPQFQGGSPRISPIIIVAAVVDEKGDVGECRILSGRQLVRDAARLYVQSWKFMPLTIGSKAVKMRGTVSVFYDWVKDHPVLGLDLPAIEVLSEDSFVINSKTLGWRELQTWLKQQNVAAGRNRLHLRIHGSAQAGRVTDRLRNTGASAICLDLN